MIGFIGTSLQLQSIIAAQNQWLFKSRCIHYCSVFCSTVTTHERRIHAHKLNCLERRLSDESLLNESESDSHVTTDGQPASLSWNKVPFWGLRPDLYYRLTVAGLLIWGALSDERTGLSFTIAAGPRQRSHFRVRVPSDSWPYLLSQIPYFFSSPPTTRRATVEVFYSVFARVRTLSIRVLYISRVPTHKR
jgi:hypothetical protein